MNIKLLKNAALITSTAGFVSISVLSQLGNAQTTINPSQIDNYRSDRVSFYCGTIANPETGEKTPTTLAYIPQRQAKIPIVAWTSQLAAWSAEKRCDSVSAKFQTFYQDGRLNYITNGESAGYPIICALLDKQEECSGENQLFQVKAGTNPEDVIAGLNGILRGNIKGTVIEQSSDGQQTYISISGLLENTPAIDEDLIVK